MEPSSDERIEFARSWFPKDRVVWDGPVGQGVLKIGNMRVALCSDKQTLEQFKEALAIARPNKAREMTAKEAKKS